MLFLEYTKRRLKWKFIQVWKNNGLINCWLFQLKDGLKRIYEQSKHKKKNCCVFP